MGEKEDHMVSHLVGDFGKWQASISILLSILKLPIGWFQLAIVFLSPKQNFYCAKPFQNETDYNCRMPCEIYEYDRTIFSSTIVSEWDLVCDRNQLSNVVQMTFMMGILLGNLIFGIASDRLGRKFPLVLAITLQAAASFALAFVPWFWCFLLLRFVLAIATGGTMVTSFVLCMEIVGGKWRTSIPILYQIPFGLANSLMAVMAYFVRDWRHLTLLMSILSFTFISYQWLLPESPRWLLATGRTKEAIIILKHGAKKNNLNISSIDTVISKEDDNSVNHKASSSFMGLFRTPNLRQMTLSLFLNWFVAGLSVFGFMQYMGTIGDNNDVFINFAVGGLVTIPGTLLCIYVVKKFGRRSSIILSALLYGTSCMLVAVVPIGYFSHDWPRIALAAVSLTSMSVTFPALYLYSGELLPTVARNGGLGAASMFARLGSMLAPFILSTDAWHESIPLLIFGGLPVIAVLVLIPLPETRGRTLPDSLEDGEQFKENLKIRPSHPTIGTYTQITPTNL